MKWLALLALAGALLLASLEQRPTGLDEGRPPRATAVVACASAANAWPQLSSCPDRLGDPLATARITAC